MSVRPKIIVNKLNTYDLNIDEFNTELPISRAIFELLTNAYDSVDCDKSLVNYNIENNSIIIQDQGVGIKRENLRLSRNKHKPIHTGTFGLGLKDAISIIVGNGGNISIESKYLKVSHFVRTSKSKNFSENTWQAVIIDADPTFVGTKIIITINNPTVYLLEAENRLIYNHDIELILNSEIGQIYKTSSGKIKNNPQFYKNVMICETNSIYVYNIFEHTSIESKINRDRTLLSPATLNPIISKLLLKVPNNNELFNPIIRAYSSKTNICEIKYAAVKSKLDQIISLSRTSKLINVKNGISVELCDPTPTEQSKMNSIYSATGIEVNVVSRFYLNKVLYDNHICYDNDDNICYIHRFLLSDKPINIARKLGDHFLLENIPFEDDNGPIHIHNIVLDIVDKM